MAIIDLTDGNTYTFAKINNNATILDSSDSAHAKKVLRQGLDVTGSIEQKVASLEGLKQWFNGDIVFSTYCIASNNNSGVLQTYTNGGSIVNKLDKDGVLVRANSDVLGSINIGDTTTSTESCIMNIGSGRTGNGYSYIDMVGDNTYTDYGLRVIRHNSGPNAVSEIAHRGTGNFEIDTEDNGGVKFKITSTSVQVNDDFYPTTGAAHKLGQAGNRWTEVFANLSTINTSDRTLKKNIETSDLGLEFVKQLNPVKFNWKTHSDSEPKHYGFIAQEVNELANKNDVQFVREDIDGWGIRYTELISPMVKAIQELTSKVEVLEARIQQLENQ